MSLMYIPDRLCYLVRLESASSTLTIAYQKQRSIIRQQMFALETRTTHLIICPMTIWNPTKWIACAKSNTIASINKQASPSGGVFFVPAFLGLLRIKGGQRRQSYDSQTRSPAKLKCCAIILHFASSASGYHQGGCQVK